MRKVTSNRRAVAVTDEARPAFEGRDATRVRKNFARTQASFPVLHGVLRRAGEHSAAMESEREGGSPAQPSAASGFKETVWASSPPRLR